MLKGDPAHKYLTKRIPGLRIEEIPSLKIVLRHHERLPYYEDLKLLGRHPSLIGAIQDMRGRVVSLHLTYLSKEGKKAPVRSPKKIMSPVIPGGTRGAAVKLFPACRILGLTEGLETALAVHVVKGLSTWSCISAGGLEAVELPSTVREVAIFGDNDTSKRGQQAAHTLAKRLLQEGRKVDVFIPEKLVLIGLTSTSRVYAMGEMKPIGEGNFAPASEIVKAPDVRPKKSGQGKNSKKGDEKKKKKTQEDILIEIGLSNVETLFEDQYKEPFARIRVNKHCENWPVRSTNFRRWLGQLYYRKNERACNPEATRTAICSLEAHAMFNGAGTIELHNRCAWKGDAIWYDLSNETWQAVKVTCNGWEIIDDPPILFRRFANQTSQVIPAKKGSIERLLEITNLKDEKSKILAQVWLVSTIIPCMPHPAVVLYGSQGSAKSTFSRYAKDLIDPGIKKQTTCRGRLRI